MDPITQRAHELLERLSDERLELQRRERAEIDRQYATGERREWEAPDDCEPSSGLPPDEVMKVRAWARQPQATAVTETVSWSDLDKVIDVIGEETGKNEKKILEEIKRLREQVLVLRGEVNVLRGIARGEMRPPEDDKILEWPKKRNDAA
jgi:hypothetical protein